MFARCLLGCRSTGRRTLDLVTARDNVVFLGPPGTGKTHLATGLAIRGCQAGHRVAFAAAADWVARLADAHHSGQLPPTCSSSSSAHATSAPA
jgi:DNA replication protein DnaC